MDSENSQISSRQRRNAIVFFFLAGGILWIPLGRKLLGTEIWFLRDLGLVSGPGSAWYAWTLALLVAIIYSGYFVRYGPPTVRDWWQPDGLKLLAVVCSVAAAIVEEAFFRRFVMDRVMCNSADPEETTMTFGADAYEWLVQSIGPSTRNFDIVQMKGGTSSSVFLIRCSDGSSPQRFVLRVIDNQDWVAEEPDVADHEAAVLEEARRANLRAPHLVAYSSEDVGFGAPVVLMSFLEGTVDLRPSDFRRWLDGLAGELALIHQHTADTLRWDYSSWVGRHTLAPPEWTAVPHIWERAIDLALHTEPNFHPVLIHRDYHPMNVLWHNGALRGVVDWPSACRGPAGVDVAHCRINLAKMFGLSAADQFLETYSEVSEGFEYNPYWDVDSILDTCFPRPKFYSPWRDFGLDIIPPEMLNQRVDTYIESVMARI